MIKKTVYSALLVSNVSVAATTNLNCTYTGFVNDTWGKIADYPIDEKFQLKVDIENHKIDFGQSGYEIVQANDHYITGVARSDGKNVGGDIMVLNRNTGEVTRALVHLAATLDTLTQPEKNVFDTGRITGLLYLAQCEKPIL